MKKFLIAAFMTCAMATPVMAAPSANISYQTEVFSYPGIEIDGCEITFAKGWGETNLTVNIFSIAAYYEKKGAVIFKVNIVSGTISIDVASPNMPPYDLIKAIRKVRNKCAFVPSI